jgi:hypothetical protein
MPVKLESLRSTGPNKQTELAEELGLEGYAMSRLLEVGSSPLRCQATGGNRQTRQPNTNLRDRPEKRLTASFFLGTEVVKEEYK